MRKPIKIALFVFLLVLLLPGQAAANTATTPFSYYIPVISRVIPPQRLGPFLGTVMTLAADYVNPGVFYAGTWGSGIYKSLDRGQTWAPASAGLSNLLIQTLAVDRVNPAYVYAGTYYDPAVYSGVYRSKTGGQAWQPGGQMVNIYNGAPVNRPVVYALAVDPLHGGVLYAGTRMKDLVPGQAIYGGGGVFKSSDHGATLQPFNTGLPPDDLYIYDLSVSRANPSQVYAAVHVSGAYATDDGGANWYNMNAPDTSGRVIAVDPFNPLNIIFGVWHGMGLFRTEDRGSSWRGSGLSQLRLDGLTIDSTNSSYVYASTSETSSGTPPGIYASIDNGQSWSPSLLGQNFSKVAVDPFDGRYLLAGSNYSGILRSSDHGASWGYSNWGLSGFSVTDIAVNPANRSILYAGLNQWGVMKSTDRGANWAQASAGLPAQANLTALAMDPNDPQVLYAATSDAGVYVTRDGAQTWTPLLGGYPGAAAQPAALQAELSDPLHNRPAPALPQRDQDALQPQFVTANVSGLVLAVSPTASRSPLVGTQGRGVLRLVGAAWNPTTLSSGSVYALLFDQTGKKVFAGMDAGSGSLKTSTDDGLSWAASATGLTGRVVYTISQSKQQPDLYYVGTDAGVYRSEDGGATWSAAGLTDQAITAVMADPNLPNTLTAGSPAALYSSPDKGATWQTIEPSLDHFGIQRILQDPADSSLYYLATRFGGVVRVLH